MKHLMTLVLAVTQPSPAGLIGIDAVATQTIKGAPATFDLAGFRLGMTEAEVERVLKERDMAVRRRTRVDTFEDRVRKLVNLRGGRLQLKGGSVLDNAVIDDGKGGKIMIRMLAWPDGARIRGVTYLPPPGTDPMAWRSLLTSKYGAPSQDSGVVDAEGLHVRWCGRDACLGEGGVFLLAANVGVRGGQILLSQPDGTAQTVTALVEQEAMRRGLRATPAF